MADRSAGPEYEVLAAGAVVWRERQGAVEVLLVHRPKYDDWSLPKGKLDDGEDFPTAAAREVEEETGVAGDLGAHLGEIDYIDGKGRSKLVRWWAIHATREGRPENLQEIDELRWVSLTAADDEVSYATDVTILDRFRATLGR